MLKISVRNVTEMKWNPILIVKSYDKVTECIECACPCRVYLTKAKQNVANNANSKERIKAKPF